MHKLYVFSNPGGGGEFVVISDWPPVDVIAEHTEAIVARLDKVLEIKGDATSFPCDRRLRPVAPYNVKP